ncbi:MAG TPA: formylmethanofuran dehydrogenase [Deltaproteobacteria bacterium]|nr:formylmethanofuran dehydrogenase [Deltaproteobacteria bacterium]
MTKIHDQRKLPADLKRCVDFHGHICPGLIYGYRLALEAIGLMDLHRAVDEEIVAICENDSCAIDALQVLLGTAAGKGNLIIKDYGKNAYTIISRMKRRSFRFSRTERYEYQGTDKHIYDQLNVSVGKGIAGKEDQMALKQMKINDLLSRPFSDIFTTKEMDYTDPLFAPLQPSEPCALCGEMTMTGFQNATKECVYF